MDEVVQGEMMEYTLVAEDPDSQDPVQCRLAEAPQNAEFENCTVRWLATAPPGSDVPFRLAVSDTEGASSSQQFMLRVLPHPQAPIAVINMDDVMVPPGWLTLDGSGSSPGRDTRLTHRWSALRWPDGVTLPRMENTVGPTVRALLTLRGTYAFQLIAQGETLQSEPAEVEVQVVNVPPIAVVSEDASFELTEGDELFVELRGSDSVDPNPEDAISCTWSQSDGPTAALEPNGMDLKVTMAEAGVYTMSLTCSDGELDSEPGVVVLTVTDAGAGTGGPVRRPTPEPSGCFNVTGTQTVGLLFAVWLAGRRRRTFP